MNTKFKRVSFGSKVKKSLNNNKYSKVQKSCVSLSKSEIKTICNSLNSDVAYIEERYYRALDLGNKDEARYFKRVIDNQDRLRKKLLKKVK